ncbi:hypothetical protein VRK_25240 [Vibrio sp. MEBiC08052]|nr:hypothetical protein VRK_25240 [Vibrio sp. MEBiC08052]
MIIFIFIAFELMCDIGDVLRIYLISIVVYACFLIHIGLI